ncbi:putative mycothiosynthase [Erwinia phage vB_EamM_Joad]|uniref:Putative mycothiosynthase n=1 Tax=Erwinia phage vB_EamM_Joad TaxID=2026081 RepID=A0A223LJ49_9CAUD|nr:putative mycothiosynthase [Erwinia phage vB_EamM_Joad]
MSNSLRLDSSVPLVIYMANKAILANHHPVYEQLLERGIMDWRTTLDTEGLEDIGMIYPFFNCRDHNFEKLGVVYHADQLPKEMFSKYDALTDMVIITKETLLTMLDFMMKPEHNRDDFTGEYVSTQHQIFRDYLNAVTFDDNTILVALINDGYDFTKEPNDY